LSVTIVLTFWVFIFNIETSFGSTDNKNYWLNCWGKTEPIKLKIWINAFIPSNLPNIAFQIPTGTHSGEWAIKGPLPNSGSFLTDQRDFDTNIQASFRMQSTIEIDLTTLQIANQSNTCGKTVEVDTTNGQEICSNTASTSAILLTNYATGVNPSGKKMINFTLDANAANPCYFSAPSITWKIPVTVLIDTSTYKVSIVFDGYTKAFPAFEMYAQVDDSAPIIIFQRFPDSNATPWSLLLSPDKEIFVGKDLN